MREALVNLVAQVVNVNIHNIRERLQVVAPDCVNDLRAREHTPWMAHQVFQQGKLLGCQLDDTTVPARFVPHQVEYQITHRKLRGFIKTTIAPAQQGVDARQQFLHGERLGQVVIGPHIETRHTVLYRSTRGEHQHGCHNVFGTQLAAHLEPVNTRQHQIKYYRVIGVGEGQVKPRVPVVRQVYGVTLFQQDAA